MTNPMRWFTAAMVSAVACAAIRADAADPHAHHRPAADAPAAPAVDDRPIFEKPDAEIKLEAPAGTMKFDREMLTVAPGAKVKLTLVNHDEMQHNFILCAAGEGVALKVAQQAWALGVGGPAKQYVPESDLVLAHTRLVNPHQSDTIYFTAPEEPGDYPYVCTLPGHAFTMRGVMRVSGAAGDPAGARLADLTYRYYEGSWTKLPDFDALAPAAEGKLPDNGIDLAPRKRDNAFGFVFLGKLHAPAAGEYAFSLDSDDGSRLLIDGKVVIDHDGLHSAGSAKVGKVALTAGSHDLRVDYFEAAVDQVISLTVTGPGVPSTLLSKTEPPRPPQVNTDHWVVVTGESRIVRGRMPGASARAIAVGLPGEISYCFDAERCSVRYGWWGPFVDAGPERGHGSGRGGGGINPLGARFNVGDNACAVFIPGIPGEQPAPKFLGYKLEPSGPTFRYQVNHLKVAQKIESIPGKMGLRYGFAIEGHAGEDVTLVFDTRNVELASTAGAWDGGKLTVPAADAGRFSVTVIDATK